MNVLIIGSGGREHALAIAISKSRLLSQLYSLPGNPGINEIAEKAEVNLSDFDDISNFCIKHNIELVVIGPEQPLADGLSDHLRANGINVFGPSKYCAQLESSKAFAKDFMKKYQIPTADYQIFNSENKLEAIDYLKKSNYPVVIKADGLAAGKGVVIAGSFDIAQETIDSFFSGLFSEAGKTIVIEEYLDGEEASILAVTDGTDFITLASSQDHKRIFDGDQGPNTGGMGAYAPAPIVTKEVLDKVNIRIIKPVLDNLRKNNQVYIGCLYVGLMIKENEPKVIEFNVRFGDPETQAVLPLFEGDFLQLINSASIGAMDRSSVINPVSGASCCVVLASDGYPGKFEKGFEISGISNIKDEDILVFHAGTSVLDNVLLTNGGRVLGICGVADNLENAVKKAYIGVMNVNFKNMYYRKDIAHRALKKG